MRSLTILIVVLLATSTTSADPSAWKATHCDSHDPISGITATGPTIVMMHHPDSGVASFWWREYRPEIEEYGFTIHKQPDIKSPWKPVFRVYYRGRWHTASGELYWGTLRAIAGGEMARDEPRRNRRANEWLCNSGG